MKNKIVLSQLESFFIKATDIWQPLEGRVPMKQRVSLTIDPRIMHKAKQIAQQRQTSVSQLVEDLLSRITQPSAKELEDLVDKWAGKLTLAPYDGNDPRRERLWKKYGLTDHADTD